MSTSPDGDRQNPAGFWEAGPETASGQLGDYRLIDVRQPEEYTGPLGHIAGAELVPLATLPTACEGWDKDAPLLLICRSGGRSHRACAHLKQAGFRHLTNLVGGMTAWNQAGLDVER